MTTRVIVRWLLLGTAAAPGALSCRLLPGFGTWTKRLGQGLNKGCTIVSCPSCLLDRLYIRVSAARRSVLCLLCSGSHAAAQLLQAPIAPARVLALVHVDWYWCIICSKACVVTIAGGSFNTGGRARRLIVQRTERKEPRRRIWPPTQAAGWGLAGEWQLIHCSNDQPSVSPDSLLHSFTARHSGC